MPKGQQELGTKSPFKLRVGIDIPSWRGVNKEGDPGAISADEWQDAINVRILPNGATVCRGGQTLVNGDDGFDGCVMGIIDDEVPAGTRWWFGTGFSFDPLSSVIDDTVTDEDWLVAAVVDGVLFVLSADKKLYTWNTETQARTLVHDFATADAVGASMVAVGSVLYVCFLNAGAHTASVWTWNGAAAVLDHTFAVPGIVRKPFLASYGGEAYLTFVGNPTPFSTVNDTPNKVWRRVAGVWTSLAMPVANFGCFDWIVYGGNLYLAGSQGPGVDASSTSAVILKYDGVALTLARQIGDPDTTAFVMTALAIQNGELCYFCVKLNTPSGGLATVTIGTFDGSVWTDTVKDLSAEFGTTTTDDVSFMSVAFVTNEVVYIASEFDQIDADFFLAHSRLFRSPSGTLVGVWAPIGEVDAPDSNQTKAFI